MKKLFLLGILLVFVIQKNQAQTPEFKAEQVNVEYERFVLPNGLVLLVHEDHKAPIVAVNVWYHVGSKNEKPGKSGFAHLFEHLMFNGSENFDDDYFQAIERIGGTDVNGTTSSDRTNYFQNVPIAALDQALFLESDRMGHLLGVIDQEVLDEQRGVVQNEKRQGENQPYGQQRNLLNKAMHPKGHPYSWTVIGEMEDLNAASVEDVHEWFKSYYGAANTVLSIAGDITPEVAYQKVLKYFGDIPAGPTIARQKENVPVHNGDTYEVYEDRVPEARVLYSWNTPTYGSKEDLHFDLIAAILSSGKNSRLYKRLVYEDRIASNVAAYEASQEIASTFVIRANVVPRGDVELVKAVLLEELNRFLEDGPTESELKRVKASYFATFIKGLERIGGFGGKSDILASNETYHGDPAYYKKQLKYIENATAADLKATAQKWLTKGKHTLICLPFPTYTTTESSIDRSKLPELTEQKSSKFPTLERAKLSNGLNIILAKREGSSSVIMNLMVNAGYKSDYLSSAGTAKLAMNLLDEGTKNMNSLQINEQLQLLGANINTGSDGDISNVYMNTLEQSLDASIDLFADVVLNPTFPQEEFDRIKLEQINQIRSEKAQPVTMALRVMNKYMYGEGNPNSNPYTGSGYEETVEKLTRDDIVSFYDAWIKPNNATLIVTGNIEMEDLTKKLEKSFGKWKKGDVPTIVFKTPDVKTKNTLYLMDRPESLQSVIIAGHLTGKYGDVSEIAMENMITILGGSFTSRINMNLREDKHWAYGASGFVLDSKQERPFLMYAAVQTDKSSESIVELQKEISEFITTRPATADELNKVQTNQILKLPGQWETNASVSNSISDLVKYNLPDNYYQTYDDNVRDLTLDDIISVSKEVIKPENVNWFVVGDKELIMTKLKGLGFDAIVEIDADGNPIIPEINIPNSEIKN